jgi:hypothetical protein
MCIRYITLGIALLLAGAVGQAQAGGFITKDFKGNFAGTALTTRMDLNNDGILAGWSTAVVDGTFGQRTNQAVVERKFVAAPGVCAAGQIEFALVAGKGVGTFVKTRDQIFTQVTASTYCFDPATGEFSGHDTTIITGGTGKFEGATGSLEQSYTGSLVLGDPDPASNQSFGPFSGEYSGTINLPKK